MPLRVVSERFQPWWVDVSQPDRENLHDDSRAEAMQSNKSSCVLRVKYAVATSTSDAQIMTSSAWTHIHGWRSSTSFITIVICYAVFVDQVFFAFILPVLPYSLPEKNGIRKERGMASTKKFMKCI